MIRASSNRKPGEAQRKDQYGGREVEEQAAKRKVVEQATECRRAGGGRRRGRRRSSRRRKRCTVQSLLLKSSADAVIHESFLGRIEDIESFVASKTDLLKKQKDVPRQHRAPYISMRYVLLFNKFSSRK
ncbi:hypothetical protein EJB05_25588, partial [Eragrostis curvula]